MDARSETDVGKLRAEMEQLRTDMSKVAETLKTMASQRAESAYQQVRGAADKAAAEASHAADSVGKEISARPFTSVAAAFGVGILLGLLFGRRA